MANRLKGRCGYPSDNPMAVTLHEDKLREPLRWKKPARIFVNSMGDLFHEDVPFGWLGMLWKAMWVAPQHTYMILTKRPERMKAFLDAWYNEKLRQPERDPDFFPNLYLGVTAENQEMADKRIPILLQIPAAVRFVSVEPMLGPVDLTDLPVPESVDDRVICHRMNALTSMDDDHFYNIHPKLDWVICGAETGHHARPAHPDWFRSLRDQCKGRGVLFFFKGWGEHIETELDCVGIKHANRAGKPKLSMVFKNPNQEFKTLYDLRGCATYMERVGKKQSGHLLDGVEHHEFLEVER